jgi:hypothetical protein
MTALFQTESESLRLNVREANEKLKRMEYVCKQAERNVDVERRSLDDERATIQSSLRKNVTLIHRNVKRMTDMREAQNKIQYISTYKQTKNKQMSIKFW